jgi:fructokinase
MDIVCLGELLIDMFPAEVGRRLVEVSAFYPKPGGAPANVAVAVARLGAKSAFIGKVGDDAFGHFLVDTLAQEQVDTRGIRLDPAARTTMAFIALPDPNHAEFVFYRHPGADTLLHPDELDRDLLQRAAVLHFGSVSLSVEPSRSTTLSAVRLAREAGALISFDVNYRPSLWPNPAEALKVILAVLPQVHLLKVNEVELELLSGSSDLDSGSQALLAHGPQLGVITLGPHGSFFRSAQGSGSVPGFTVTTVDAIGCGDAFVAGLLTQLLHSLALVGGGLGRGLRPDQLTLDHLHQIVRYANAVGALTATKQGVIPALPTAAEVSQFLAQKP